MRRFALPKLSAVALGAILFVSACTFEPGSPWGWIDADLQVQAFEDSDTITVIDQHLTMESIQLRAPGTAGGAGIEDFDPTDPPPGYTLCHQGHCHTADGRTESYEEIRSGGGNQTSTPVNIATRELDALLQPPESNSTQKELPIVEQTSINEVAITISEIFIAAAIEENGESFDLEITLSMATRPFQTGIFYTVGRSSPEHQQLDLELSWPPELFDELTELNAAIAAADNGLIEVHGTSNRELRDELLGRVTEHSELIWIE